MHKGKEREELEIVIIMAAIVVLFVIVPRLKKKLRNIVKKP